MKRDVTRPVLFRPPDLRRGSTSDFSGVCLVMSSLETEVVKRRLGVVGLYVLIAIKLHLGEFRNLLSLLQLHPGLLPVRTIARKLAPAPQFTVEVGGAYRFHLYFKQRLHRLGNLNLVGIGGYFKAQRPLLILLGDALFRHQRPPQYVMDRAH